jgi:N-acetylglucosamine-6-phosphate deacetylase
LTDGSITGRDPGSGTTIAVDFADGLITGVRETVAETALYLSAGLVDLQVNGHGGVDFNAPALTPEGLSYAARQLARLGTTTFLPTLITASEEALIAALRTIAAARQADPLLAHMVPFVHVEGPFLAAEDGPRGAHPREHIRAPDIAEFERWQAASRGLVGMVTLSPHYLEAPAFIAVMRQRGVHVSLGHTGATPEEIRRAVDAGAQLSTHLGNGAAAMLPRHPNLIWAQLADDRLTATYIADGHHLPADTFKAMLRAKGTERSILISDATSLAGRPPGVYDQPIGGKVELSADGRLSMAGTPYLAGAVRSLADDVAIAIDLGSLPLAESLALATLHPGRFAGDRGRLEPGAPADLIRFAWAPGTRTLDIETVLLMGREVD